MLITGVNQQTVWLAGFCIIETAAISFSVAALRNVAPDRPRAFWTALTSVMAPAETFTPVGWKYRVRAFQLQGIAVLWLLIVGPVLGA